MKIIVLEKANEIGNGKNNHFENNLNEIGDKKLFYFGFI